VAIVIIQFLTNHNLGSIMASALISLIHNKYTHFKVCTKHNGENSGPFISWLNTQLNQPEPPHISDVYQQALSCFGDQSLLVLGRKQSMVFSNIDFTPTDEINIESYFESFNYPTVNPYNPFELKDKTDYIIVHALTPDEHEFEYEYEHEPEYEHTLG
jgi:hypothetical protein